MRLAFLLLLITGCASVPQGAPRNWVDLFNDARNWREKEVAFQEMQRNDHIRLVEQGLRVVGIAQNAGSNPPTGHEREAVIFWTAVDALHDWQDHPDDFEAKNRTLVGMRRLMELERLGWKVGAHVKWFVARAQELEGVRMPAGFPAGKARWIFGLSRFGSYQLYLPRGLHDRITDDKNGGVIGRTLASVCFVTTAGLCLPLTDDRLSILEVDRAVHLTVLNASGDPVKLKGVNPSPGEREAEHEE